MTFWGVEVKPSRPYSHQFDTTRGRLHVSQATLGNGTSLQKCSVQCSVRNKAPVLLCSLFPEKAESCSLDLEFADDDNNVIFSVIGPRSVHIAGYSLGHYADDSDSYGEDIQESENSTEVETDDDSYEDDFIDDADLDTPSPSPSPSPSPKPKVTEEISVEKKLANGNGGRKRLKKKYQVTDSDGDYKKESIIGGGSSIFESESEDEDALPITYLSKTKDESAEVQKKSDKKASKRSRKKLEFNSDHVTGGKRKHPYVQGGEIKREPCESGQEEDVEKPKKKKKNKKKRKERSEEEKAGVKNDDKLHEVEEKSYRNVEEDGGTEAKKKKTPETEGEQKTHRKRKKMSSAPESPHLVK